MSFLFSLFHRVLMTLAPETAHRVVMASLRVMQWGRFRVLRGKLPGAPAIVVPGLSALRFRNRVGLAAGFDKNAEAFAALFSLGFGFVEIGTVTPEPQPGNPLPRIWRRPEMRALVNHMGFPGCGLDRFLAHVRRYRPYVRGAPLFANVGKNKATPNEAAVDDYAKGFRALENDVDGFVVNLSSPNTPGLFSLQTGEFLESIARVAPRTVPILVKLSPDLDSTELRALCEMVARDARFQGVVLTNTSRKLADSLTGLPAGGLSGAPLAERALECVGIARAALPAPKVVIGVGGIVDLVSARRFRAAGADLVELYTGFIYGGPPLVHALESL